MKHTNLLKKGITSLRKYLFTGQIRDKFIAWNVIWRICLRWFIHGFHHFGKNFFSDLLLIVSYLNIRSRKNEKYDLIFLLQFSNIANPLAHYESTGAEILYALDNKVDAIVSVVNTGGSFSGIGRRIKEKCPNVKVGKLNCHKI